MLHPNSYRLFHHFRHEHYDGSSIGTVHIGFADHHLLTFADIHVGAHASIDVVVLFLACQRAGTVHDNRYFQAYLETIDPDRTTFLVGCNGGREEFHLADRSVALHGRTLHHDPTDFATL